MGCSGVESREAKENIQKSIEAHKEEERRRERGIRGGREREAYKKGEGGIGRSGHLECREGCSRA